MRCLRARKMRTGVVIASVLLGLLLQSAEARTYRNPEFGMVIPLPAGQPACSGSPQRNHGIRVFLDPNDKQGCPGPERNRRAMGIFAYFNVVDATKYLTDYLQSECRDALKGQCFPAPMGLRFGPYRSISGRVDHHDGWIDIVVVAQGPIQLPDNPTGVVNYSVSLQTDRPHFMQDLSSFRRFLRSIRLIRPE
jgi:hypothetical protein